MKNFTKSIYNILLFVKKLFKKNINRDINKEKKNNKNKTDDIYPLW